MENVKLTERELMVLKIIARGRAVSGGQIGFVLTALGEDVSTAGAHRTAASLAAKQLVARAVARPVRYALTPLGSEVLRRARLQEKLDRIAQRRGESA